jgi:hypothetical protein
MRQTAFVSTVMTHLIEMDRTVYQASTTILYYTILYYTILYYTILYYTILYYTIPILYPHESEAGGGATDPVIPAKNHRQVLRHPALYNRTIAHPTLVVQLRSVESLRSKGLRAP